MSILGAIMSPHPPLIIPQVGRGQEDGIAATTAAMHRAARFAVELGAETLVVISPHATAYADYNHISPGREARGDFGQFGAPFVKVEAVYDESFVKNLSALCEAEGFSAGTLGERDARLDHGTMIPLHFIFRELRGRLPRVVRVGVSGLPPEEHYTLGMLIQKTAETLERKVVVVASGDLSHKLKEDGPYGLSPEGAVYDEKIMDVMGRAAFLELFEFPEALCTSAAECGHRSFIVMAGCLDGLKVQAERLSYEGPFGVGYGVCTFKAGAPDASRRFLARRQHALEREAAHKQAGEDAYVRLARKSFTAWITKKQHIAVPDNLPDELTARRAGVFVTLHKAGQLRGCIGTISPAKGSLAEEIIQNAISASTQDPRFSPVTEQELSQIECSVDVLGEPEDIDSMDALDPQRYGVIVSHGHRRGLLLPALDGVDTPAKQVEIARRKAGIGPDEAITLQRFEVIRHH
ncbi:MAG TPA: AmmeMemoRadiSam system protein A [Candidatus Limiplasma sp.]|nr:AmmeMemoRadiSam system protein A [Candidatus Limiplasma sp.]